MTVHVMTNHMVEHVWAQRTQDHGRSVNGNYSFDGDVLYSYSTPIAKFWRGTRGRNFVLITSESFSVTTNSKHMPSAYNIPNVAGTFHVPFVRDWPGNPDKLIHQGNADYLAGELRKRGKELARFHQTFWGIDTAEKTLSVDPRCNALQGMAEKTYFAYCEAFGVRKGVKALERELVAMCDSIRAAHEKYYSPKQVAKRAKYAAKRIEARESAMAAYESWASDDGPIPTKAQRGLLGMHENMILNTQESQKLNAEKRRDWIAGVDKHIGYGVFPYPMLRIKPTDSATVETSMRAEFPLAHAVKAFRFIKRVAESGEAWQSNGHRFRIGLFAIERITGDGTVIAGCHRIPWAEIERFARKIGIFEQAE